MTARPRVQAARNARSMTAQAQVILWQARVVPEAAVELEVPAREAMWGTPRIT